MRNKALGRGLSLLLKEETVPISTSTGISVLNLDEIEVNKEQPRKHFDEVKIKELADSIISNGLVQPIIVTKRPGDTKYKIVAGERRFRACKIAGLEEISVIVKQLSEKEILEIALVENIQRQELTVIEEAEGFAKLIAEFGYTPEKLGNVLGKSRSHVANLLRLNNLPESIKQMINEGKLSMGHARCLVGHENAEILALKIIESDLNVRQAEELTRKKQLPESKNRGFAEEDEGAAERDADAVILGQSLSEKFGVKVVVESSWNGGKISFHYRDLEELDMILMRFK
jgi:ParB family chromosome partitioning protein